MEILLFFVPKFCFKADPEIEEPTDQELEELGFTDSPAVVEVLNPPGPRYF